MISTNLRIVAIAGSVALLVFIVELVRRRRLKEEYSVLWVLTGILLLLLAAWGGLLRDVTHAIGATSQASTLYFFGLIFVIVLLLHFSVRVSNLERRVVVLLQEVALLGERARRLERGRAEPTAGSVVGDRHATGRGPAGSQASGREAPQDGTMPVGRGTGTDVEDPAVARAAATSLL